MSKGWHGESQKHSMASKGIRTSVNISAYGEEKLKEYVKMNSDIYSQNKAKIKKIYKEHGLIFDKAQYYKEKFIWENENERVELVSENNVVTIYWEGKEKTKLLEELKTITKQLGGIWEVKKEDKEKKKTESDEQLKRFDGSNLAKMIENERMARHKGFNHCPILKPMVKEYLEEREKKFGKSEKSVDDMVQEIYKIVDERYPQHKRKDDWEDDW